MIYSGEDRNFIAPNKNFGWGSPQPESDITHSLRFGKQTRNVLQDTV